MSAPVVLGRDTLKLFKLKLARREGENDAEDTLEILNILADPTVENVTDPLHINAKINDHDRMKTENTFVEQYVKSSCPKVSQTLNNHNPSHTSPRRISYAERNHLREIIDNLLSQGTIRPSDSEYASPNVRRLWHIK
ncbi:hypothetical protein ANTRET_LOCUS2199 [Anthophora retusa]